ncbi:amino acid transporter [Novosphingobium sp.]|uniref:POT-type proton-dependent oligopeptide transporter n=1 Tax=Novosphingobium sp. TaxID=1874826 RepID=UPI0031D99D46
MDDERSTGGTTTDSPLLEPRFLALAMMEFWERFAMAGVKSLLVLMLVDQVLAGDLARVAGATTLHRLLGPVSTTGFASQLYGCANALIYLSIPLGGLVGDLGGSRRLLVLGGGGGMLLGLMLMLGKGSFLIGLIPFALGTGLLKGNLSAQLGMLYANEARRRRAYTAYLGFLNAGTIGGPLVCGALALFYGPVWGLGAAAAGLTIGLGFYARSGAEIARPPVAVMADRVSLGAAPAVGLLIVALAAVYLCFAAYEQLNNIFLIWARTHLDLRLGGWAMPVAWFLSLDGAFTLMLITLSQWATRALERRGHAISASVQVLMGGLCCTAGYLILTIGSAEGPSLPLPWAITYVLLIDAAIVLIWPSGLSLIAGAAPRRRVGFWMGLFYLHGFFANLWVGFSGVWYDRIGAPAFWLLHAGVAGCGALLMLVAGLPLMGAARRAEGRAQAITTSA